jgi:hypothetical protein
MEPPPIYKEKCSTGQKKEQIVTRLAIRSAVDVTTETRQRHAKTSASQLPFDADCSSPLKASCSGPTWAAGNRRLA